MRNTDNSNGWIKLHRSILQWEWWDEPNTTRLFIYCLLKANPTDKLWHGETIERGSFVTSLADLSAKTGLSLREVRTSINRLISTSELTSKTTNKYTVITICNFDRYQQNDKQNDKQNDNQTTNERQTNDNNEEYKNIINNLVVDDVSARDIVKSDLEERRGDADEQPQQVSSAASTKAPTPQPPAPESAPADYHGDRYEPLASLYARHRWQYHFESETTNAIRMKIKHDYGELLTAEQVGRKFDEYHTTLLAGGMTIETPANYRSHFRNWLCKQYELQKEQQKKAAYNGKPRTNNPSSPNPASSRITSPVTKPTGGYYTDF